MQSLCLESLFKLLGSEMLAYQLRNHSLLGSNMFLLKRDTYLSNGRLPFFKLIKYFALRFLKSYFRSSTNICF